MQKPKYLIQFIRRNYSKKPAYYQGVSTKPLAYATLGQQFERTVEKYHNREAFVACQENKSLTYGEALNQADLIATKLIKLGLKPGDHIGLWAPNTIQWFLTFIAAARANLVLACINPALQASEIKYALNKAKCKAIFARDSYRTHKYYDILKEVIPELKTHNDCNEFESKDLPHLKTVIIDSNDNNLSGVHRFEDILKDSNLENETHIIQDIQEKAQPDSPINIQFTSGTTGQPKAALITNFSFVNSSLIFGERIGLKQSKHEHRLLLQAPLFHAFGLTTVMANILYGSTLVIPCPTYNPKESLKMVEQQKCTLLLGSPTMLIDALAEQSRHNFNVNSLRTAVAGGSTCTPQVYRDVKKTFDLEHFNIVYGLSECTAADFASYGYENDGLLESTVGKIYDHLEAKVVDDEGKTVKFGESGELYLRGFAVMKEYCDDEERTKEILGNDGWLKTGDQFILYESGYGCVVGRKKDIIIRGGENIFPKEIEDFLETHPDILESQVVGVPDERLGEEIFAFLRMKDNCPDLTLKDIKEFSKGKIANFKVPKHVQIVDEFPKTTSGKIQKYKLKDMIKNLKSS